MASFRFVQQCATPADDSAGGDSVLRFDMSGGGSVPQPRRYWASRRDYRGFCDAQTVRQLAESAASGAGLAAIPPDHQAPGRSGAGLLFLLLIGVALAAKT